MYKRFSNLAHFELKNFRIFSQTLFLAHFELIIYAQAIAR